MRMSGITSGKSGGLPTNVDPFKNELKNKEDRARMGAFLNKAWKKLSATRFHYSRSAALRFR